MSTLTGIAVYDPRRLSDADFLAGFVARYELVDFLLNLLRTTEPGEVGRHQNIIGQRGMGKTTLLRRLAMGMTEDPALAERYIPLTFREEQYNVRSLDRFWRNCGEALAEWAEATGRDELAERLDRVVDSPEWRDPQKAAKALLAETDALGRRPVLLVDNFDLILNALPQDEQWALRKVLQKRGGPILYCASVTYLEKTADREAPFYEFFGLRYLEPLTVEELIACMRRLATSRGEAGRIVEHILEREPERLRTLHTLTGGNPRVLTLLYQLLERAESETVFADLEALLDQLTPFYKARVEDYSSDLQRAVIDAVALHWDPIIPAEIAAETGIKETTLPAQLQRLTNDGILEQTPTSVGRTAYQLSERFFNIWYLMRHGTRRTRQRMRWLTAFLRSFYALEELRRLRQGSIPPEGAHAWRELYCAAVDAAIEMSTEDKLSEAFGKISDAAMADEKMSGFNAADLPTEEELRCLADSSQDPIRAWRVFGAACITRNNPAGMKEAAQKILKIDPRDRTGRALLSYADIYAGQFDQAERRLGELIQESPNNAHFIFTRAQILFEQLERPVDAEPLLRRVLELRPDHAEAWLALAGVLFDMNSLDAAEAAAVRASDLLLDDVRPQLALGFICLRGRRMEQAGRALSKVVDAGINAAPVWQGLGASRFVMGDFKGAIEPFRKSLELGKELSSELVESSWVLLAGCYLQIKDFSSAEEVFRAGLDALPASVDLNQNYADFLIEERQDYASAESVLRRLTELQPDSAGAWFRLGNLLSDLSNNTKEAERIYREGLDRCEDRYLLRANLVWLLVRQNRLEEATKIRAGLKLAEVGNHLLDAAMALRRGETEAALKYVGLALDKPLEDDETSYLDDLLRLLRMAVETGHGAKFTEWFETSGNDERHRPVYVGFVAFIRGVETLLDVNPEVRASAQKIYRWLAGPRSVDRPLPSKQIHKGRRGR